MWVWSDELVERASTAGLDGLEPVQLVAYAVASGADLDEMAIELLSRTGAEEREPRSVSPRPMDR